MVHSRMLRYLDEVVRAGSIRQAAERLNVASSAINRQIIELETQFGTPLFTRLPRGLRLTASGEILISHIRQVLKEYDRTRERMLDLEGLKAGTVAIAAMHGPAEALVPYIGSRFREKFPRVTINVRVANVEEIVRLVDEGDVDIGLCYNLPSQHGLHVMQTYPTRLGAVVAAKHPLASKPSIRLSDCISYPIVWADSELTISRMMRAAFHRANIAVRPAFISNSTAMMKAIIRDGIHLTFLTQPNVYCDVGDEAFVYVPIVGSNLPLHPLSLVHRANSTLGLAASMVAEQMRASLERMVSKNGAPAEGA